MSGIRPGSGVRRQAGLPATDVRAQFGQAAPGLVALEPRVLLDAAALETMHELAGPPETGGEAAHEVDPATLALVAALAPERAGTGAAVFFVDAGVGNPQAILSSLPAGAEVHLLDTSSDGVAQIAAIVSGRTDIGAIHLLSHGSAGALQLGSGLLTADSMTGEHADDLATISAALSAGADILVYGCDFGAGPAGAQAMLALAGATGADIAASEDLTGAAALGGDWDLEQSVGSVEAIAIAATSHADTLTLGNTAGWTVAGLSASNSVQGVTATIAFSAISPQSSVTSLSNNTFNASTFFANGADGDPSLAFVFNWDAAPEAATSTALPPAVGDGGNATLTITFSQPVTDPIIHLDRLGGNMAFDPNNLVAGDEVSQSNSTLFTLTTPGATLTDLSVPTNVPHFEVTATTIQRTPNQAMVFSPSAEAGISGTNSTAAGSVRVNGTFTSITFVLSGVGVEGAGGDGIEIGLSLDAPPDARNDGFVMNEDATLTGNLFADNGSGADSDPTGDARTITAINGVAFTVGAPIPLANGVLTITNAATGAFTFAPTADYAGGEAFTYTVADANGGTDTASVSIAVNAVNDNPVADDETVTAVPGQVTNIPVLVGDTDVDGGSLNVTHVNGTPVTVGTPLTLPSGTQVTLLGDGTLDVVMAPGSSATETFTYTVSDGNGGAGVATVTLNRDSDGDGVVDATDIDDDNDGIVDTLESVPGATGSNTDPDMIVLIGGGTATIAGVDVTVNTTGTVGSFAGDAFLAPGAHINPGFGVTTSTITYTFSQPITSFTTTIEAQQDEEQITFSHAASSVTNVLNSTYGVAPAIMSQATLENGGLELRSNLTDVIGSNTSASFGSNSIVTWTFATPVTSLTITHTGVDRGNGATNYNGAIIGGAFTITAAPVDGDADSDGVVDRLDIDSDNDGITDNVEAQTTAGYVAPSGFDSDGNGLDDAYESAPGAGEGLTPVDTDGDATADIHDADSDNDGSNDIAERGDGQPASLTAMTDTDGDGLLDIFEGGDANDGFDANDDNRTATTLNLAGVPALAPDGSNAVPLATDLLFRDVNDPPVGVNDTIPVVEDTQVTVNVLGNDTDIDGDPLTIGSAAIDWNGDGTPDPMVLGTPTAMVTSTGAAIGVITVGANGDVTFVPAQDYNGPVPDLTYVPNDGTADGSPATVTLGPIVPANDPPEGANATFTVALNGSYAFTAADFGFSDPNDDPAHGFKSVIIDTLPAEGTLLLAGVPVTAGQEILVADIANLVWNAPPDLAGSGLGAFDFRVVDDGPAGDNLLVNGSLEDFVLPGNVVSFPEYDSPAFPGPEDINPPELAGWSRAFYKFGSIYYSPEMNLVLDADPATADTPYGDQQGYFGYVWQTVTGLTPGETYTVSGDAILEAFSPVEPGYFIMTVFDDADYNGIDNLALPPPLAQGELNTAVDGDSPDWRNLTFTFVAPASGTIDLVVEKAQALACNWDNISVSRAGQIGQSIDQVANTIRFDIPPNDPPQGTDNTFTVPEDGSHTFSAADFGFTDPNDTPAHNFVEVIITTLPSSGTLTLAGTPVAAGQVIPVADIPNLVWTAPADQFGTAIATFDFQVVDDGQPYQDGNLGPNLVVNGGLEDFEIPDAVGYAEIPYYGDGVMPSAAEINPPELAGWSRVVAVYENGNGPGVPYYEMPDLYLIEDPETANWGLPETPYGDQQGYTGLVYQTLSGLTHGATYTVGGNAVIDSEFTRFEMRAIDSTTFDGTILIDENTGEPIWPSGTLASASYDGSVDGTSPDWRDLTFTFVAPASGSIDLLVFKGGAGAAACSWDNISVQENLTVEADTDPVPNTITFNVNPVNDPPVGVNDTIPVVEDTPVTQNVLGNDTDIDGGPLTISSAAIDTNGDGNPDPLTLGVAAALTDGLGNPIGTITVAANGDVAFAPASNYTGPVPDLIYTPNDGTADGSPATVTFGPIVPVNDPPVLDLDPDNSAGGPDDGGFETTFTENGPGVAIVDADLVIADPEDDIVEIVITLTNGQVGDMFDFPSVLPGGVTASVVPVATLTAPGTMTLTLTGTLATTGADWTAILQSVLFEPSTNDVHNPDVTDRVITIAATDTSMASSPVLATVVHVIAVNDPPTLDLDDDNSAGLNAGNYQGVWVENDPGAPISSGVVITDLDDTNLESLTVTLTNGQAGDLLAVGVLPPGIVIVGPAPAPLAAPGTITVTLSGTASLADYQAAIAAITFANDSEDPAAGTRTISVSGHDGESATPTRSAFITVQPVNDAPYAQDPGNPGVPADAMPPQAGSDGRVLTPFGAAPYFADPDNLASELVFALDPLTTPAWLSIDPLTGVISGTPSPNASQLSNIATPGVYEVTVIATDPGGLEARTTLVYTIINPPPSAVDDALAILEGSGPASGSVLADNGNGPDSDPDGDTLVVTAVNGNALNLGQPVAGDNGGLFTLNGDGTFVFIEDGDFEILAPGEIRTTSVTYTISDGQGGFDTATFAVTVTGTNDAPIPIDPTRPPVADPTDPSGPPVDPDDPRAPPLDPSDYIPAQAGDDGAPLTPFDLSPYFGDPDGSETPVLSIDPGDLPPGLVFDPLTNLVSGTPSASASQGGDPLNPGTYTIPVTATDPSGATFTTNLTIVISNPAPDARDDALTADEDSPVSGSVFDDNGDGPDSDPDGDTIVVSAVGADPLNVGQPVAGSAGGTFTIDANGNYTFDPGTDFNGLALGEQASTTIAYQISDGQGGLDTALVTVIVHGVNDAPVVVDPLVAQPDPANPVPAADPATVIPVQLADDGEDFTTLPLVDVSDYVMDPDASDTLAYSTTDPLPAGLVLNPDGTITGIVDPSASLGGDPLDPGIYVVNITVDDSHGGVAVVPLTIDVSNLAPVAVDDHASGTEDSAQSGNVITDALTGDSDALPDTDPVAVIEAGGLPVVPGVPTVLSLAYGTLTLADDGAWTFMPNGLANTLGDGDTATEIVTYTISDGEGGTATATLTIDITGVNDPVQVVDPTDPGTDPADPSYDPVNPPVIPDPDNLIPDVLADDGDTITPLPAGDWFGDAEGDVLTFSATGLPPGLAIDPATGEIAGTLDPDASQGGDPLVPGTYLVTVIATDPQGNIASTTVTFTVSNLPPVARDDAFAAGEDGPISGSVLGDNGNGADADDAPDNDPLTVSAVAGDPAEVGQPVEGDNGGVFVIHPDGTFSFDPGNDFQALGVGQTAITSIAYEVSDGNGGYATATVTVTVTGANDAPIPVDPSQPAIGDPTDPLAPPTDPDDPRAPPVDPLDYLPHLAGQDGDTIAPFDLTPWFGDPDAADTLVLSLDPATLPSGLVFDPATGILSGTLDHSASQGGDPLNPGVHVIAVTATDPSGATFVTFLTFTVSNPPPVAVDDAVIASEDVPLAGNVLADNGAGVDADASPDSDPVHVVAVDGLPGHVGLPASGTGGGTFTIADDGSFVFDPGIDFQDLDVGETRTTTITYTISDGEGGSATATVTVTVEGANDGPVVIDPTDPGDPRDPNEPADPFDVVADQLAHDGEPIVPLDLSAYFVDVDDEPLTFAIDPAGAPTWLSIDPVTGLLTGTPPADASQGGPGGDGIYTVTITATDPDGASAATLVDIIVSNLPPLALDDVASASEDVIQSGNVLTDPLTGDVDTPPDADPIVVIGVDGIPVLPGSPVTLALTHGTLVLAADGSWTFAPNGVANTLGDGEAVVETVTYEIADGNGGFASATLSITIEGVNDPVQVVDPHDPGTDPADPSYDPAHPPTVDPSLLAGPLSGADGTPFEPFAAAPFFGDAEGDTITYSATGLPAGLMIDPLSGVISGTPASDASVHGPYSVTVIATDPQGNVAALPVDIAISNPAPVVIDELADQETFASTPHAFDTAQAFDDPDGDTLTYSATGLPDGMTIDPATGRISGTPVADSFLGGPGGDGLHAVTVTVDDGQGGTNSATFLYQVRPLPHVAPVVAQAEGPPSGPSDAFVPPAPGEPILTSALHAIRPLGEHVGIGDARHPVTFAVGQIGTLGAPVGFDPNHPIDDVVQWIEQARVPAGERDDGRISGLFDGAPWLGHDEPIGFGDGESRAHARIVLWQGRTWLELLSQPGANMSWSFRGADGSVLPPYAVEVSGNLLAIARPADRTWLGITVHGESASGAVVDQQLSIDLVRGRIVLGDGPRENAAAGLTFQQQASQLIDRHAVATSELLAALGG